MDVEEIKKKVRKIYENYGISIDGVPDEDLGSVYSSYIKNPEDLLKDYKKSEEVAKKIRDDEPL